MSKIDCTNEIQFDKVSNEADFNCALANYLKNKLDDNYEITIQKPLYYVQQIKYLKQLDNKKEDYLPEYINDYNRYKIDILIQQKIKSKRIPRVAIELKYNDITTHDLITYSHKLNQHKLLFPYLRYGVIIANKNNLTQKIFKHGKNFDFIFAFSIKEENNKEENNKQLPILLSLINDEIKYSEKLEKHLFKRNTNAILFHKPLIITKQE